MEYVAGLLVTLKQYKTLVWHEDPGSSGVKTCSLEMFIHQIDSCYHPDDPIHQYKICMEEKIGQEFPNFMGFGKKRLRFRIERADVCVGGDIGGESIPWTPTSIQLIYI